MLPIFKSLLNDREFCVTSDFLRVPVTRVIKRGLYVLVLLRPPQKAEALFPSHIILLTVYLTLKSLSLTVLSNGNVMI